MRKGASLEVWIVACQRKKKSMGKGRVQQGVEGQKGKREGKGRGVVKGEGESRQREV